MNVPYYVYIHTGMYARHGASVSIGLKRAGAETCETLARLESCGRETTQGRQQELKNATMSHEEDTDDTVKTANISITSAAATMNAAHQLRNDILDVASVKSDVWNPWRRESTIDRIMQGLNSYEDARGVLAALAVSST
jgi:hypothetical protein